MMVVRHLDQIIKHHFDTYKEVLVILGSRQVGKTTILRRLFPDSQYYSVDNEPIRSVLEKFDPAVYRQILKPSPRMVILDEIHLLSDPGRAAKIIYDQMPEFQLIITGSSALDIKNKTSESLAGRKVEYRLFPLSFSEYLVQKGITEQLNFMFVSTLTKGMTMEMKKSYPFDLTSVLDNVLIYGLYPAILSHQNDALYLRNLVDSIVLKDLLELSLIENRSAAFNLLKLLAYQIGNLVNFSEIASRLGIDVKTVRRYIQLFEQSFIVFTLVPYSMRKRSEIGKMPKIYFYDIGLRNALIDNFQPLNVRSDAGAIFENFIISETLKANYYGNDGFSLNFWRTKQGSEVDLVLTRTSHPPIALEIKSQNRSGGGKAFLTRYPDSSIVTITKENFLQ